MEGNGHQPAQRVSDAWRESFAALLRRHVADGRLDLDEFSDRLDDGYGAKTTAQLEAVLADLPPLPDEGGDHFRPAYPILGGGPGLALHGWWVYGEGAGDGEPGV